MCPEMREKPPYTLLLFYCSSPAEWGCRKCALCIATNTHVVSFTFLWNYGFVFVFVYFCVIVQQLKDVYMSLYLCNCLCICVIVFFLTLFFRSNWAEWVFRKRALCNHDKKDLGTSFNLISLINSCPLSLPAAASITYYTMIFRALFVFPLLLLFNAQSIDLRREIFLLSTKTISGYLQYPKSEHVACFTHTFEQIGIFSTQIQTNSIFCEKLQQL